MACPSVPIYKDEERQMYLAYWYDKLARHLLKAKPLSFDEWMDRKTLSHYDLYDTSISACVEVKGSSNMDQMKLFEDQLDAQIDELGFPFDSGFTWIFSYNNRQPRRGGQTRSRLLKRRGKTSEKVSSFLAKNTTVAYAIDSRFLGEFRRVYGTHQYTRDKFRDRQIVSINRIKLRKCADVTRTSLADLGLSDEASRWLPPNAKCSRSRIIETEMDGNPICFELVLLLPNALKCRLLKQMNGSVKKM